MSKLRHTGVVVSNLDKSLFFYCDLLGLRRAAVADESGPFVDGLLGMSNVQIKTVKLGGDDGSGLVELLLFKNPDAVKRRVSLNALGPTHFALTVTDLDGLYETLIAEGVPFNAVPAVSVNGLAKVAFCQDPDGTYIELVEELESEKGI